MRRYYILGVGADDSVGPLPPLCKGRWQKSPSQRFALTAPFTQGGLLLRLFYRRSGTSSSRSTQSCTSTVENSVSVLRMTTLESPALMTSRRHMAQEVAS